MWPTNQAFYINSFGKCLYLPDPQRPIYILDISSSDLFVDSDEEDDISRKERTFFPKDFGEPGAHDITPSTLASEFVDRQKNAEKPKWNRRARYTSSDIRAMGSEPDDGQKDNRRHHPPKSARESDNVAHKRRHSPSPHDLGARSAFRYRGQKRSLSPVHLEDPPELKEKKYNEVDKLAGLCLFPVGTPRCPSGHPMAVTRVIKSSNMRLSRHQENPSPPKCDACNKIVFELNAVAFACRQCRTGFFSCPDCAYPDATDYSAAERDAQLSKR